MYITDSAYTDKIIELLNNPLFLSSYADLYNDLVSLNDYINTNTISYKFFENVYLKYLKEITNIRTFEFVYNGKSYTNEGLNDEERFIHTNKVLRHSLIRLSVKYYYELTNNSITNKELVNFDDKVIYDLLNKII